MTQTFKIKRGDTSPSLQWELNDPNINLAGATVIFNMKRMHNGNLVANRAPAEVVAGAARPTLAYNWQPADTDIAGTYQAEFEITFADQSVETNPNDGFILVIITPDLG